MKHFVLCALAALVLFQAAAFGFKVKRVIYVVAQASTTEKTTTTTTTTATTTATTPATTAAPATTTATAAQTVIVYCTWKNNWCRPASNTVRNCKWGLCKFSG